MIGYGSEAGITIRVPEILNYEYLKTIREELTYLKDYIPPIITTGIDTEIRYKFLTTYLDCPMVGGCYYEAIVVTG